MPGTPAKRTTIMHGAKPLLIPVLSAPVGSSSPALATKYPQLNSASDVAIIDHYLTQLERVKALAGRQPVVGRDAYRLTCAVNLIHNWKDRAAAIGELQRATGVNDAEELTHALVKPGGQTLRRLVDLGDVAEKLLARGLTGQRNPAEYVYRRVFDRQRIAADYPRVFGSVPHYGPTSLPQLLQLLGFMEADPSIIDIRWRAYMLATALIETSKVQKVPGATGTMPQRVWTNYSPVEETGHGKDRDYYLPVKVRRLPDGSAMVTE